MLRTLGTFAIVLFWLSSVAWLCATVWAPPESRMAQIDPMEVYEVFFTSSDATTMTLLENGRRRGEVTLSAGRRSPLEEDGVGGEQFNALSFTGSLARYGGRGGQVEVEMFWRVLVDFTLEMERFYTEVNLRFPSRDLALSFQSGGDPPTTEAAATLHQQEIFSLKSDRGGDSLAALLAMASGRGVPGLPGLPALPGVPGFAGAGSPGGAAALAALLPPGGLEALSLRTEARRGSFSFAGHHFRAYLLILRLEGRDEALRLYFSESGEPLRIATDFGFEAVSEMLVPLDAYRPGEAADALPEGPEPP